MNSPAPLCKVTNLTTCEIPNIIYYIEYINVKQTITGCAIIVL